MRYYDKFEKLIKIIWVNRGLPLNYIDINDIFELQIGGEYFRNTVLIMNKNNCKDVSGYKIIDIYQFLQNKRLIKKTILKLEEYLIGIL
ncbi:MAG: hypothetical protein H7836_08100 [Magnetococcus sp. YQC-3]